MEKQSAQHSSDIIGVAHELGGRLADLKAPLLQRIHGLFSQYRISEMDFTPKRTDMHP